ncbi:MAG: hypothetical protein AAFV88_00905 [Planctomycetota bacterium]
MATTVDKIRRALEKRDGIAEEEMKPLAEAYRKEVQTVNQRLDDAIMLLRKGLRSEAIQRVELTPNALDAAAELEFPEWDEWNDLLQFMGIPLPPKLNQDDVAQINEAIIESLPLDALLKRHRRLAIAKAPLSARLRTLRQIARVDSNNAVWMDDIEIWEKARLGQIDAELKRALDNEDARVLQQLHQELTGTAWRIQPPGRLIEQTSFAAETHRRQRQESELSELVPAIQQAFEIKDEATARSLRTQWQETRARYGVDVAGGLNVQVATAFQWLEDLDRQAIMESEREMAVANLQTTLQSGASSEEVHAALDQASRFGHPVPDDLAAQAAALAEAPAKKAKQKKLLLAAGAGVVVIGAAIGGVMLMLSAGAEAKREETITQMTQFVNNEQYTEAARFYQSVQANDPETASSPKMVALQATARKAQNDEAYRRDRFDELLAQATSEDPALIDQVLFPQLDELAATDGERARVNDLRRRKSQYVEGESLRQSDKLIEKIGQLRTTFESLRSRGTSDSNLEAIRQLLTSVTRLPKQFPLATDDAVSKQETLRSLASETLSEMRDANRMSQQREEAIDSLVNSRSIEVFSDRMREFATRSIAQTGFAEFSTVLNEEDHWLAIDRTNAWLTLLQQKLANGVTAGEAASLIESRNLLASEVYPNPALAAMPTFVDAMEEIQGRRAILDETFNRIARHPIARAVTLPIRESGTRTGYLIYKTYAEENASRLKQQNSIGISILSDELGGVRNRGFQGPLPEIVNEPLDTIRDAINNKAKKAIEFDQQWEITFLVEVSQVMRRPNLSGVHKEWLIYQLLDAATQGSESLRAMIPQTLQVLQRRASVRDKWFEPREFDDALNSELERTLRTELNLAYKRFQSPLAEFQGVADSEIQWIGFLARTTGGEIEYHPRGQLPERNGKLFVSGPPREGASSSSILTIGELRDGHVVLDPNPIFQVPGRPVFWFPDQTSDSDSSP